MYRRRNFCTAKRAAADSERYATSHKPQAAGTAVDAPSLAMSRKTAFEIPMPTLRAQTRATTPMRPTEMGRDMQSTLLAR